MRILFFYVVLVSLFFFRAAPAQEHIPLPYQHSPWVDSVLNSFALDQGIGPLVVAAAYSGRDRTQRQEILRLLYEDDARKASALLKDMDTPTARVLKRKLMEGALTVLRNERDVLPVRRLDTLRIASVSFGVTDETTFQKSLGLYTRIKHFTVPRDAGAIVIDSLRSHLKKFNFIIAGIHDSGSGSFHRISFSDGVQRLLSELPGYGNVVMAVFKHPEVLDTLHNIEKAQALIMTYEDHADIEQVTAQLIFGGLGASGRLPTDAGDKFLAGQGLDVSGGIRFCYTLPEEAGMDSEILFGRIDSLVQQALDAKAIPGCQVFVARDKKVVMHKAYGVHAYSDTVKVKLSDLYDLASVTKISTSMAALMKLYDEGKFKLDATLSDYLPKFKRSNTSDIPMVDILTHQARFIPWIPFWKNTLRRNGSYKWATIKKDSSGRFPIKLRDQMYLHRKYPDKIVNAIRQSPLRDEKKYVYSDFFFILAPRVVEGLTGEDFSTYLTKNFYAPLGSTTLTFNPLDRYSADVIVPTEHDFFFRHQPIHGTVHDEGAVMLGGISGHAGLFANANDLAKLMQMYLDRGEYGGNRYIHESTLKEFSRTQFPENNNRRALGFDKPNLTYRGVNNNTAEGAGPNSFGHTGYTGTFTWMDPDRGLLYIFLANRVTPSRDNNRLYLLNTRTQIQQVMYEALRE